MPKQTIPVRNGYVKHRPETERRAWVRFPKDQEVWCQPTSATGKAEIDTAWLGRVRDVSTAGIGLSMTRRFEPGGVDRRTVGKAQGVTAPDGARYSCHARAERAQDSRLRL